VFRFVDLHMQRHTVGGHDDDLGGGLLLVGVSGIQRLGRQARAAQAIGRNARGGGDRGGGQSDAESGDASTLATHS